MQRPSSGVEGAGIDQRKAVLARCYGGEFREADVVADGDCDLSVRRQIDDCDLVARGQDF